MRKVSENYTGVLQTGLTSIRFREMTKMKTMPLNLKRGDSFRSQPQMIMEMLSGISS